MGRDLAATYPQVCDLYAEADTILGFGLSSYCFEGPQDLLNDTINTQPALLVTSLAVLRALEAAGKQPEPAMVAGHSLGELTALVAASVIDFASGLRLARERGRLMKRAGEHSPGGMAAVLNAEDKEVETACREASAETGRAVQIANYNSQGQVVISGDREALANAIDRLRGRGIRRIVPLAVSIAAHSPLMASAVRDYRAAVDATPMRQPRIVIVGNISARPLSTVGEIRDELAGQLTWPVRWTASVQWMENQGISRFVEIGPRNVLSKLVKQIAPAVDVASVASAVAVEAWA